MIIRKLFSRFPVLRPQYLCNRFVIHHRNCSTTVEFLNPDEIGNLSFNLNDKRISNLLSRFRMQYDDTPVKSSDDYSDFINRLRTIENQMADIDHQIEELRKNFADCSPALDRDVKRKADDPLDLDISMELGTTDSELAKLVDEDRQILSAGRGRLDNLLLSELAAWLLHGRNDAKKDVELPKDLILEVSAGVGGQEAMLFTKEIFHMYRRYAQYQQWNFDIIEEKATDLDGLHFAAASISGSGAYAKLRFEGGVHRVQRVPVTERTGRVHTSTMSVAILPQPPASREPEKVNLKEFRFEQFRPCAPGGQNVNKSDAGSRITHLPTGITVSCQMERQVHVNRDLAFRRLLAILYDRGLQAQQGVIERSRKLQVGSLARSEKIRTYNYQQDRITDHRTKHSFVGIEDTLAGGDGLDRIVRSMLRFHFEERLSEALDKEEKKFSKREEALKKAT